MTTDDETPQFVLAWAGATLPNGNLVLTMDYASPQELTSTGRHRIQLVLNGRQANAVAEDLRSIAAAARTREAFGG